MNEPTPFSTAEIAALRRWHRKVRKVDSCAQGDPWPCRTARFLATLDSVRNVIVDPVRHGEWYGTLARKFEADALAEKLR